VAKTKALSREEAYLENAIDRYSPAVASTARTALKKLRARFPGARVLVYDRLQSLGIGFAPAERGSPIVSIVLYPRWARFFFLEGIALDDPQRRLEGAGNQVRSIRLDESAAILDDPYMQGLIAQAQRVAGADLAAGKGGVVLKSVIS